jgi:putative mRNA 3-end processing factor
MDATRRLGEMGFTASRRKTSGGKHKPHFSLTFRSGEKDVTLGIDTTRLTRNDDQHFLITHAHTDHYGKSAMLSKNSIASDKTAMALELRHDQRFEGTRFKVGDTVDVEGVQVKTYHTYHSIGSTAFYWENEVGIKTLVTGDIKDHRDLPKCDLLVMEATYGNPDDLSCVFKDDYDGFQAALGDRRVAFGAYSFGKAQRAVSLIREMGDERPIEMDRSSLMLTRHLLGDDAGEIGKLGEYDGGLCITSPWSLDRLPYGMKKYVLTGQHYYDHPCICISDHIDFNGLRELVDKVDPKFVIVYHPEMGNSISFSKFLNRNGREACTLAELASARQTTL